MANEPQLLTASLWLTLIAHALQNGQSAISRPDREVARLFELTALPEIAARFGLRVERQGDNLIFHLT